MKIAFQPQIEEYLRQNGGSIRSRYIKNIILLISSHQNQFFFVIILVECYSIFKVEKRMVKILLTNVDGEREKESCKN